MTRPTKTLVGVAARRGVAIVTASRVALVALSLKVIRFVKQTRFDWECTCVLCCSILSLPLCSKVFNHQFNSIQLSEKVAVKRYRSCLTIYMRGSGNIYTYRSVEYSSTLRMAVRKSLQTLYTGRNLAKTLEKFRKLTF